MAARFIFLGACTVLAAGYLLIPSPGFPPPPPGSLQSQEPADTESPYRRAYYTNLSRSQLMQHYESAFDFPFQLRLNHPPEEAYSAVRDQTRSSWLEQLVNPGREKLYVNGFFPTLPTEQINISGVHYLNKITVRHIPSSAPARLTVLGLSVVWGYLFLREYVKV